MNSILQIILIVFSILFLLFILSVTRQNKLSYKYTLLWLLFSILTILFAVFPQIIVSFSKLIHIKEPTNALFLVYIFLLLIIVFYISVVFTKIFMKATVLVQENAMLEKRVSELEEKMRK